MANVLYISYDGMTDPLGQSQVIPYLQGLVEKGNSITLLSCEKEENFEANKDLIQKLLDASGIEWRPIKYHRTPPVISTIKDVRNLKKEAKNLHLEKHFDIIHCRSYISSLVGLWMKRKFNAAFIFDMRGFWADERVDGKLWNLGNPLYKLIYNYFKKKEKEFLKNANYVISLTTNAKNEIHNWEGFENVPIEVIPCCADLQHFDGSQMNTNQLRQDLGFQQEDYILSYVGSIGTWYMLDEMLWFFNILKQHKPQAKFFFITRDNPEHILEKARSMGINQTDIIVKPASRKEVPEFISISDASIFFIKPVFSKKASSPTKQAEIMAMNIPVVCNTNVGDTDHVVNTYHSGVLVDKFSTKSYEKAINELLSSSFSNLRSGAEEFYSLEKGVDLYQKVYAQVTSNSN